jgi:creatinine amidohydrolase
MNESPAPVRWDELTWEDVAGLRDSGIDMAILPVGATEQHGLHLPLGVDSFSATAVAEGVSARTGIPVLPALSYGCSLGHSTKWPGTLSLRPETLARVVFEIAEWIVSAGFDRLLLLNGHVTNWAPLRCGLENIRHEFPQLRIALRSIWEISGEIGKRYHEDAVNFHANCAETSVMLALRPELVRMEKAVDEPDRAAHCFFAYSMDQETEHGAVGNPTQASERFGQELLELCIEQLSRQLEAAVTETTPLQTILPEPRR